MGSGEFWDDVASLPGLSPVIDYQSEESVWARYITALHLMTLAQNARPRSDDRFLDYGCGVGRITTWLAPQVAEVVGLDTSAPMVAEARQRCREDNVRFEHVEDDLSGLALGEFDGATLVWVLQHILDDGRFGSVVDLLKATLRPRGRVYCIDRLCRDPLDHGESEYLRLRSRQDYEAVFRKRGFRTRACHPVCIDEQVLGRRALTGWVKRRRRVPRWLARLDLAWARRQPDPFIADFFWEFERL